MSVSTTRFNLIVLGLANQDRVSKLSQPHLIRAFVAENAALNSPHTQEQANYIILLRKITKLPTSGRPSNQ